MYWNFTLPPLFFQTWTPESMFLQTRVMYYTHPSGKEPTAKSRDLMSLPCVAVRVGKLDFLSSTPPHPPGARWFQRKAWNMWPHGGRRGSAAVQLRSVPVGTAETLRCPFSFFSLCRNVVQFDRSIHFVAASVHRLFFWGRLFFSVHFPSGSAWRWFSKRCWWSICQKSQKFNCFATLNCIFNTTQVLWSDPYFAHPQKSPNENRNKSAILGVIYQWTHVVPAHCAHPRAVHVME